MALPAPCGGDSVGAMRRLLVITVVLLGGCGDSSPPPPQTSLANGETGEARAPVTPAPVVPGVPDGGVAAGHGGDVAEQFARTVHGIVRVPARDNTPPLALLLVNTGAGQPVVHDSPVRARARPAVRLARPELSATALIRDADGGTGRIRVSVVYATRCNGVERQHAEYVPPAQIENVRIAPGVRVPRERSRSARVRFPAGCGVAGKAFAEATNAHGLESFSDPIWFEFRPRG
jgi:hypothetical protein